MYKGLEEHFSKSGSRYQFNIDRIAEKYCGSNKRDLALEALQRDFGEASISSPVVELKDKSHEAICRRLNEEFEKDFEKRIHSNTGNRNAKQSTSSSNRELRSFSCSMLRGKPSASVSKYTINSTGYPNIANMLTNSAKGKEYRPGVKRLRAGPISSHVIDVITSSVKEGPVEIDYDLPTMTNNTLNPCDMQSSSNIEQLNIPKNGKFLEAWFSNEEGYWAGTNFARNRSLRWPTAFNA
ncbi:eEF1A lysine and N-terminal methyltransferase [Dirofilaria immitis]